MINFCSITPVKDAKRMYDFPLVMLLAHLSKKYPEYAKLARLNDATYKIMDNSIIELGSAFKLSDLIKEATKCQANEIILPDVFQNGPKTVKTVKDSIKWLKKNNKFGKFNLMAVCHGKDYHEFICCFQKLNSMKDIDVIGIPKIISTWCKSRGTLASVLSHFTMKQIHLLGCYDGLNEIRTNDLSGVRSMDTCLPALLSIYNMNTWDKRKGKKIDLEKSRINEKQYNKICSEITRYLSSTKFDNL